MNDRVNSDPAVTFGRAEVTAKTDRRIETVLLALFAAAFLTSLDRSIFAPLLPALSADFRQPIATVALAVSAYTIPYGFFQLFYGPAGDRSGKVAVVRWAFLCFAIGTGLCALATTMPSLYALRAITGAAAASVVPMSLAFIGDVVPYDRRQPTITNLMGATSLGSALSTAMGGIIGEFLSWRALFILYGLVALVVAVALFRVSTDAGHISPAKATPTAPGFGRYSAILRLRKAQLLYLTVGLEGITIWGGFTYLGAYMHDRFNVSYLAIGLTLALYGTGTVLTSRFVGRALRGRRETDLIVVGGGLLTLCYLAVAIIPWWPVLAIPMFGMGVGFALFHSTLQTRATELLPALRGTAVAIFAFSLFFGGGIGTFIFGLVLNNGGYFPVIVASGAVMGVVTIIARKTW